MINKTNSSNSVSKLSYILCNQYITFPHYLRSCFIVLITYGVNSDAKRLYPLN